MSLLEDVFLQDEANEAEELERVIEGDEFDKVQRSDSDENSEKEDEAEEDKRRADPTKAKTTRVIKNPRFLLNPARLTGPRGIQVIPEHFKDFKFKGKGYEKEDLDLVLKKLEHWAYRLYPKFQFEDCLKKIETLGKKRPVAVHLHKIRSDQFLSEDTVVQKDTSDEETPEPPQEEDEFDKLLQQQIELARSTPTPNSAMKTDYAGSVSPKERRTTSLMMPKATSSPSINDEQRERMLKSRRLAEERRLARLKNNVNNAPICSDITPIQHKTINQASIQNNVHNSDLNMEVSKKNSNDTDEIILTKKHNRSNIIDSSDEEVEGETSISIAVEVHTDHKVTYENDKEEDGESPNIINDNSHKEVNEVKEADRSENAICDSKSEMSDDNCSKIGNNDKMEEECDIENNISQENCKQDDIELSVNDNIREQDKCVSDLNVELNENNMTSEENLETGDNERVLSDTEFSGMETLNKEQLCSTVEASSVNVNKNPSVDIMHNATDRETDKSAVVQDTFDDVMDVDFTEDF